jgi:hypothetical protein
MNLMSSDKDMTACLTNCSNNGVCGLDTNHNFVCNCFQFYGGSMCERDLRQCSSSPCMRNGTCTNILNSTLDANQTKSIYSFECKCQFPYYGKYCQLITNLCWNITCSKHGQCFMNGSSTYCSCFTSYSGLECEIISQDLKTKQNIAIVSACVAIIIISAVLGSILLSDLVKYSPKVYRFFFPKTNKVVPKSISKKNVLNKPKIAFEKTEVEQQQQQQQVKPSTSKQAMNSTQEVEIESYIENPEQQPHSFNNPSLRGTVVKDTVQDDLLKYLKESQSSNGKTFVDSVIRKQLPK